MTQAAGANRPQMALMTQMGWIDWVGRGYDFPAPSPGPGGEAYFVSLQ
jgi:hypothetical protein